MVGSSLLHTIDLFVIHDKYIYSDRHSGAGRNPACYIVPRSGQNHFSGVVPLRGNIVNCLDSGLRRNDGVVGFRCCR
jgi:hypothetical protein